MEGNGYNLSDLAAVMGNGNGFGGNNGLLFLLLIVFMMNGGAWNRGDYGNYASAASQQEILYNQHFNNLDNKMDRGFTSIGNGISDATFALNNTVVNNANNIAGTVIAEGRATADKLCELKTVVHAEGEATRAMLQQNKIETLQQQINKLQMEQAMCGVVRYPNAMTYTAGGSPFCNYPGNGCACGNI